MMPLLYVNDCEKLKETASGDMKDVLGSYHNNEAASKVLNPANRMKPLDVVKVLMGIYSSRESVKRF